VVTIPPPTIGGQTTTPVLSTLGGSAAQVANPLATALGPETPAVGTSSGSQTAITPGGTAAATAAAAQAGQTKRTQKAGKTKKHGAASARTARHQSRPNARGGATQPTAKRAKTLHATAKSHAKKKTSATAKLSRVKPLVLTTTGKAPTAQTTAPASGGREGAAQSAASNDRAAASTAQDRGIGFNTPSGRFSISPSGLQLGGPQRPIASVGGILSALLVTLAALAAVAAAIGAVGAVRTLRRNRRTSRRRAAIAANRRTREQLYSEAKRQNLRGRSNMTRAELERALYPAEQVGER
jgi:hypothetical protein